MLKLFIEMWKLVKINPAIEARSGNHMFQWVANDEKKTQSFCILVES